jgi:hypothetical protein
MFLDPKKKSHLDIEVEALIIELDDHEATSEKYGTIVERLTKLHKIQEERKPERVSPNTVATVAANLLGIVMIIRHEQLNFITSKALNFIMRVR